MKHHCTPNTDLDELIGHDEVDGYHHGPLYAAMLRNEPLELEESALLSPSIFFKISRFDHGLLIPETGEYLRTPEHFQIVFH